MTGAAIPQSFPATTPSLVLRLLSSRGLPRQGVLSLRPEGRGMADALALAEPHLDDAEWRDANRCRIVWRSEGWTLSNESRTWVCALNRSRVWTGAQAILRSGDVLEVGLMRFLVDKEQACARYAEQSAPVARSPWLDDAIAKPDGADGRIASSLFVDRPVEAWHGVAAASVEPTFITAALPSEAALAPLDALHNEFLRAVRDRARSRPALRDIPLQREGIDPILDNFEPSGDADVAWLAAVLDAQDVLQLFAPERSDDGRHDLPVPNAAAQRPSPATD